jgi:hypothetical protein
VSHEVEHDGVDDGIYDKSIHHLLNSAQQEAGYELEGIDSTTPVAEIW